MTLPIPPSDSFYKFTAIGGLILSVLSLYVPSQMSLDVRMSLIGTALESTRFKIEQKYLERDQGRVETQSQRIGEDLTELETHLTEPKEAGDTKNKNPLLDFYLERIRKDLQAQRSNFEEIHRKIKQQRLLEAQIKSALEKDILLHEEAKFVSKISKLTLAMGVIMMVFGFPNWYFKFQIYQDRLVKAQAEQWTAPKPEDTQDEIPG